MEHLLPKDEKNKGCEIIFPDTFFYSKDEKGNKPRILFKRGAGSEKGKEN